MSESLNQLAGARNPNLVAYEHLYRRRLRLPLRLNFEVQTKLAMFRRLMARLPEPPARVSVLDLGFGAGRMLLSFPNSCALAGVDIAPHAVARMRREAERRGYREHRFECLDLDHPGVPWPDSSMDMILCSHLLEHVANDRGLLAEIRRVLKPRGHLVMMVPVYETETCSNRLHRSLYTPESLRELLRDFGFRVLAEDTEDSFSNVLERIGSSSDAHRERPSLLDVLRGKLVGFLGACVVFCPPVWGLRCWGPRQHFGVLAARDGSPLDAVRLQP